MNARGDAERKRGNGREREVGRESVGVRETALTILRDCVRRGRREYVLRESMS